ncbi:Regulatory protein BlaR1 [Gimesia panareensis]|uniref:Regulatory protein BlaR1 n=1 Tax=Gimesia panareensis TaxID=2527978 RepID=A0A518FWV2_9PLAN|nr:M56 family metallopeptidase [Gimesia panareensis]QDV20858.1 Regulatory protein BlaR1 [Gimesia panareensis]
MNGFVSVLSDIENISQTVLEATISSTMAASMLVLFVAAVNILARKWLTAGQMGLLWGLVLIRLAMPIGPESSFSLQYLFLSSTQKSASDTDLPEQWEPIDVNLDEATLHAGSQIQSIDSRSTPELSHTEAFRHTLMRIVESLFTFLPLIWFVGALLLLGQMLLTHWRFTRKVNRTAFSTDNRLLHLWNTCCEQVHFRRSVPVIVSDDISQPSVMGALRPILLLPADVTELNENQLRLIMLHELAHLIRRDLWVNWILFGLRLLHWWNPLYWLADTRYHALREQSRDAMVLRWLDAESPENENHDSRLEYSELLLTLAQRPEAQSRWRISLPVSLLGFLKNPLRKRSLANRLKALRTATVKMHPLHRTLVISAIILFTISGLTDAKYPPVEEAFGESWLAELDVDFYHDSSLTAPLITRVYDLTRPLNKIRELSQRTEAQARRDMLLLAQFQLIMLQETSKVPGEGSALSINERPAAKYHEGNQLVVHAPEAHQAALQNLFDVWAQSGLGRITFTGTELTTLNDVVDPSVFVDHSQDTVPPALKKKLKLSDDAPPAKNRNSSPRLAVLTPQQKQELIQKVQTQPNQRTADHQQVTLFNGQKMLQTLVYHPLIGRPYVVQVLEGKSTKPSLKARIFEEGVRISLNPTITARQNMLHLQTIIELSEITNVETFKTQVAGKSVSIKIPDVTTRRCQATIEMKNGQSLLIALPPTQKSEFYHYLLLDTEILPETVTP